MLSPVSYLVHAEPCTRGPDCNAGRCSTDKGSKAGDERRASSDDGVTMDDCNRAPERRDTDPQEGRRPESKSSGERKDVNERGNNVEDIDGPSSEGIRSHTHT